MPYSFFLGANSSRGFYSFYDDLVNLKDTEAVYILKGCPGCGKSSLMRKVASEAEENGFDVEYIHCSSDPASLDGIIIPQLSKAIVDGTAPHIVEPAFPLAVERYVDLGKFANIESISLSRSDIMETKEKHASYFKHIYRFTSCAGTIDNELFDIAISSAIIEKLQKKAQRIIAKEIPKAHKTAASKKRFLSSVSPDGYITLPIPSDLKTYVIEDSFGLGHFLLSPIQRASEERGYSCITCFNPLIPERLEHLFIPELNLAFISEERSKSIIGNYYKKVRIDSMLNISKEDKTHITSLRRAKADMLDLSCSLLREAKDTHDLLENLYNPYIDFDSIYSYANELIAEILN